MLRGGGIARLGRYMIRCPLVLERLEWDAESGEVVYHARSRRTASPYGDVARWDVLDFIARLTQHIPDSSEQLIRYWGFYSNAARGKRRRAAQSGESSTGLHTAELRSETRQRCRISWARLLKKVFELDPLLCGLCGGQMKIVAFITELTSIRRFLAGTRAESQEPEPLAHSPPGFELFAEPG